MQLLAAKAEEHLYTEAYGFWTSKDLRLQVTLAPTLRSHQHSQQTFFTVWQIWRFAIFYPFILKLIVCKYKINIPNGSFVAPLKSARPSGNWYLGISKNYLIGALTYYFNQCTLVSFSYLCQLWIECRSFSASENLNSQHFFPLFYSHQL